MLKPPRVVGLMLCKRMAVDTAAVEMSLVGIFRHLRLARFPASPPFTAFAALYGGSGEGIIELRVRRTETEKDVYQYQRWFGFPGEGMTAHLEMQIRRCVFPAPGRYLFTLRLEEHELTQRYLDVLRKGDKL
jgi:hypothetical protein